MSLMWTDRTETRSVTPNDTELIEMTRSMVLVGYLFVALGVVALGVAVGIVAYVIVETW